MGDIYVHVRMRACCRAALGKLDEEKNKAQSRAGILGITSLANLLGEKTIDAAKAAIPNGVDEFPGNGGDAEMERVTVDLCSRLCEKHAEEHEGETEEASFWFDLCRAFWALQTRRW